MSEPVSVSYRDRVSVWVAAACGIGAAAGVVAIVLALVVEDPPTPLGLAVVLTVFLAAVATTFALASAVVVRIDDLTISRSQPLGSGWQVAWSDLEAVWLLPGPAGLVVMIPRNGPERRPFSEAVLRAHDLPLRARSVPASPPVLAAFAARWPAPLQPWHGGEQQR